MATEIVETSQNGDNDRRPVLLRRVTQVPPIHDRTVRQICIDYFGLDPERLDRLNSYDDRNYRLTKVTAIGSNSLLRTTCPDGYVLKITNIEDTLSPDLMEGQNALWRRLRDRGLPVPELVPSKNGKDFVRVKINYATDGNEEPNGNVHAVRIMHFIPGQLLLHVPADEDLFFETGRTLARVHNATEDFRHPIFDQPPTTHWSLYHFCMVKDVLYAIDDEERRRMIVEVIEAFQTEVSSRIDSFESAVIHGDFNEQNILVRPSQATRGGSSYTYDVCALLDLGDSHRTCLIFDVAIALVYMTMLDGRVPLREVGGHFLAGYFTERKLVTASARLLRLCMCARYCQSLVFGLYTYEQNPSTDNEYVLCTQKKGWPQLIELWRTTDEDLYAEWSRILTKYGMESPFRE